LLISRETRPNTSGTSTFKSTIIEKKNKLLLLLHQGMFMRQQFGQSGLGPDGSDRSLPAHTCKRLRFGCGWTRVRRAGTVKNGDIVGSALTNVLQMNTK